MVKIKSFAFAAIALAAAVGAHATSLGALAVPSSTGINETYALVGVADGSAFSETWTFSTAVKSTANLFLSNESVDWGFGLEGGINGFTATLDGTSLATSTRTGADGGQPASWSQLSKNLQLAAGAHTIIVSGSTFAPTADQLPGSVYTGTLTLTAAVPEPESYAMLLAGLGLMGSIALRRKSKQG